MFSFIVLAFSHIPFAVVLPVAIVAQDAVEPSVVKNLPLLPV
jgi:hypothetical protein